MGFSTDRYGNLCCDRCDRSKIDAGSGGSVRRYHCPFDWCQPDILCATCAALPEVKAKMGAAGHRTRGCENASARFHAEQARERELLDAGEAVRCSAINVTIEGEQRVHVLFARTDKTIATGRTFVGFYMNADTYGAIHWGTPATPNDYRQFGTLSEAPPAYVREKRTA